MAPKASLNVQCFVEVKSIFAGGESAEAAFYVSEIRPDASAHPRVSCTRMRILSSDSHLQRFANT